MHAVVGSGIDHVHLSVVEFLERSDEVVLHTAIGAEAASGRVLDDITFGPGVLGGNNLTQGFAGLEIGGYPIPASLEGDGLHLAAAGGEDNRFIVATTQYCTVCIMDAAIGCEIIDLTRRSFP